METNLDMQLVWESAESNNNFPSIVEDFPAGKWKKINTSECTSSSALTLSNLNIIVVIILILQYFVVV